MLRHWLLVSFFIFTFSFLISAQTDTSHIRISLLTCTPGEDLYSTFGHSALRVTDSIAHDDIVFNYGTFDFSEPGFYTKFIRGKLMYYLSTEDFTSFRDFYKENNRGITEQALQLTSSEKKNIRRLLQKNLESPNRFYKYDFLFDNCTTRLRDLIEKTADSTIIYGPVLKQKTRFRQLIYEYLDYGDKQWSKLGIDLLLGSKTDAIMTNRQVMFLPDYLMKTFDNTKIGNTSLVLSSQNLYATSPQNIGKNYITHPEFIFSVLLVVIVLLSFSKKASVEKFIYYFDSLLFLSTGLLGILILIMWFGTDHIMCRDNYNLLWAWPTHAIAAFYINGNKSAAKNYFKLTAFISSILLLVWFFLPQHMNISMIPVVMLLIFRSGMIVYNRKNFIS
ncbi:MAG: DUF4105 domain-containing protein [Ginsengibacter sp.]